MYFGALVTDGRQIVSGSSDMTIQLWDAKTGAQVGKPLQGHTSSVQSVAFSPDGGHIVSGSNDKTIHLWDAQIGFQDKGKITTFTSNSVLPIHFSSSAAHALKDAQNLFIGLSNVEGDSRDLVSLQDNGWIVGPSGQLLLWIPPSYHKFFFYTPWTSLVIPRGCPELDLSKMAHGPAWYECYSAVPEAT